VNGEGLHSVQVHGLHVQGTRKIARHSSEDRVGLCLAAVWISSGSPADPSAFSQLFLWIRDM